MTHEDCDARSSRCAGDCEASRIAFLLQRDGPAATRIWVRRTLVVYRQAVLNPRHFAHSPDYRAKFVTSYVGFRRWLTAHDGYGRRPGVPERASG